MAPDWIILIISTALLIGGASLWQKNDRLMLDGKRTTAIVFKNNLKRLGKAKMYFPVIRFVTEKKVWITHELSVGFFPALPEGKKVSIIYNPDNPHEISMDSGLEIVILPRILVALAIGGIAFWLLVYLGYLTF